MMKLLLKGAAAAALIATVACAPAPSSIKPAAVPLNTYAKTSCSRASTLLSTARVNLASLEDRQRQTARNDTLGVILIGVPTASATGGDKQGQIALLKGQIIALQHRMEKC